MMDINNIILKEVLNDCKEKYMKVRKLLDEDARHDPVSEPYLSKYKAKSILVDMRKSIEDKWNEKLLSEETDTTLEAILGAILLHIGVIDMETEDFSNSEKTLMEAEVLLSKHSMDPQVVITLLNIYNNLGLLWSNRDDPEKAKSFLLKAKELYGRFKCTLQIPIPVEYLYGLVEEKSVEDLQLLEKPFTMTFYYLAQVYGMLKLELKSAFYCHATLKRQLVYKEYEPIDWALNAATLSQFFAVQNLFYQSRHHLAAASAILKEYEDQLNMIETHDEQYEAKMETFNHRSADVNLCWVKYCLNLMTSSKARLMSDADDVESATKDLSNLKFADDEDIEGNVENLIFENLEICTFENIITDKYLLTYEDARKVFLSCQDWLEKAKKYYSLENLASDHIKIIQDHSQAYSYLAFFEEDDDRRSKMHKKRINMIEDLLIEINPTYYMQYCRQLWYELGEIYTDILNIKLDKVNKSDERPSPHALAKINALCDKSIESYSQFLTSLKDPKSGHLPEKIDDDVIKPVVNAYAVIARNNMKKIALDKNVQLENVTKSYEAYKAAVNIGEKSEYALSIMSEEIGLCKEMVSILPLKINKLMAV